jgi:endonuclease I
MKIKLLFSLLISGITFGQIPEYYSSIDFGINGAALRLQLSDLITETHINQLVYTSGSSGMLDVWTVLKQSDLNPENPANVLLIYGWNDSSSVVSEHYSRNVNSSCHVSSCTGLWVREHVFPNSLGTPPLGTEFAGADAHNLRAIDSQRNNTRSNRKFGNASSSVASYAINANTWYPGDEWRGDVARIIMYMYLRYPSQCAATSLSDSPTTHAPLNDMPDLLLEWNAIDPPSAFELQRNNVIASLQGNRNPFIDNPYLATKIWNGQDANDSWGVLQTKVSEMGSIYVYPTVTDSFVTLSTSSLNDFDFVVYNCMGQEIKIPVQANSLDFSEQASGIYLLSLKNDYGSKVIKVVRR